MLLQGTIKCISNKDPTWLPHEVVVLFIDGP